MIRTVIALTLLLSPTLSPAADWPRFHGPNGTGMAEPNTPVEWSAPAWKVPIPGNGHSSPVVADGRVFLQSASEDGKTRTLYCIDAKTGAVKWTRDVPGGLGHIHAKSSLASSTPAVDGGRVFSLFWDGSACRVHAYDLDGKLEWQVPLGDFTSDHGAGLSPMAFGGKVFVNYDQGAKLENPGPAELIALDARTGSIAWHAPRKGFRACSTTPTVRELPGGKHELLVCSTAGLTGYDPNTGKVNWEWTWKFDGMALRTIAGTLEVNGTIYAFAGDGGGARSAVAVVPGASPRLVWEKRKGTPYVPSPVVKGEHLYWLTDDGQAVCAELKTGNPVWDERVFNRPVSASLILAGDKVLAVAEDGKAVAFRAVPTGYEKLAEMNLGEAVFASPAAADGRLYVRGSDHLFCFAGK